VPINDDSTITYKIPQKIKDLITTDFLLDLKNNLIEIFNPSQYGDSEVTYANFLVYIQGTYGWSKAFEKSCERFNLKNIAEYRKTLEWYDLDLFDDEVCLLMIKKRVINEGILEDYNDEDDE
jgi:hypothetical protein